MPSSSSSAVSLVIDGHRFKVSGDLERAAAQWSYRVSKRARWRDDASAAKKVEKRAIDDLATMGCEGDDLRRLALAGVVQIEIDQAQEGACYAHILPWEAILTSATRSIRRGQPLIVVRHLKTAPQKPPFHRAARPMTSLIMSSGPGALGEIYSFDSEVKVIKASLSLKTPAEVSNPTLARLSARCKTIQPDVLHVTAVDARQGLALLGEDVSSRDNVDGLFLASDDGRPVLYDSATVARALASGRKKPLLVTCNAYYTACELCPHLIALGAGAAIGFQDEIDDSVAEHFFSTFYQTWVPSGFDTLNAFKFALKEAKTHALLRASGVVLWSAVPLIDGPTQRRRTAAASKMEQVNRQFHEEREKDVEVRPGRIRQIVEAEVRPLRALNYALLHNGASLFESLKLRKFKRGTLRDVHVEVAVMVGTQDFRCNESLDLKDETTDLNDRIRIPLTWEYIRSMRESTRTSLYVKMKAHDQTFYNATHPVVLLPVEEWRDTKRDGLWLPSFVLPRDPAIARIIDRAQRYLMALRDDPGAGFDGYQSVDPTAEDPSANIDLQVQAIWSTLLHEYDLSYINPPPTYTESSQRLRTPSEIIDGRRGTCIDLALLVAACLEYVEIHPLLVLLKGHCFPGYWRQESFWNDYIVAMGQQTPTVGALTSGAGTATSQSKGWMATADAYDEIVSAVRQDRFVPLETVWLTQHKGFADAITAGIENLSAREEFDSALDVRKARETGVTPLPISGPRHER